MRLESKADYEWRIANGELRIQMKNNDCEVQNEIYNL